MLCLHAVLEIVFLVGVVYLSLFFAFCVSRQLCFFEVYHVPLLLCFHCVLIVVDSADNLAVYFGVHEFSCVCVCVSFPSFLALSYPFISRPFISLHFPIIPFQNDLDPEI